MLSIIVFSNSFDKENHANLKEQGAYLHIRIRKRESGAF